MVLYLRCVWANKITLMGYVLTLIGVSFLAAIICIPSLTARESLAVECIWAITIGSCFLFVSVFAINTRKFYLRTIGHLRKGTYGWAWRDYSNHAKGAYCWRMGYELALKDHNAAIRK